jgi:hypothetical protein
MECALEEGEWSSKKMSVLVVEDEEGKAFSLLLLPEEIDRDHPLKILLGFEVCLHTHTATQSVSVGRGTE